MIGTAIRKFFPNHGWFNGVVNNKELEYSGVKWHQIIYEDGDSEYMTQRALYNTFVGRRVEKEFRAKLYFGKIVSLSRQDLWKVIYNDGDGEEYNWEELQDILVVGGEDDRLPSPSSGAITSVAYSKRSTDPPTEPTVKCTPRTAIASKQTSLPVQQPAVPVTPDQIRPIYNNEQKMAVQQPAMPVSLDHIRPNHNSEQNMARAAVVLKTSVHRTEQSLKAMEVDADHRPNKKQKRGYKSGDSKRSFVFRRAEISALLGGDLRRSSWPVVKKAISPQFVKHSEFYVANRGDWNPWGPQCAGEDGMLPIEAFAETQYHGGANNNAFHLFEKCHKSPHHPRYHGPSKGETYFYAGLYRRVVLGDIVEEIVPYSNPNIEATRWMVADLARRQRTLNVQKNKHWEKVFTVLSPTNKNEVITQVATEVSNHHLQMARVVNPHQWDAWCCSKRETAAWVELFREKQFVFRSAAVECVGYDEELYQRLVELDQNRIDGVVESK